MSINTPEETALERIYLLVAGLGSSRHLDLSNLGISALPENITRALIPLAVADFEQRHIFGLRTQTMAAGKHISSEIAELYTQSNRELFGLSRNEIAKIEQQLHKKYKVGSSAGYFTDLEWADLIKKISSIRNLGNVVYLNLSENKLTNLPEWFGRLENVAAIDLSENHFSDLPFWIKRLEKLEYLNLSNNQFAKVPDAIQSLTRLIRLNFSNNQIQALPPSMCKLFQLDELNCSHNQIASLPDEFANFHQLNLLFLGDNQLVSLPYSFRNCYRLRELDLSQNRFLEFPEELQELTDLEELRINGNPIRSLPVEIRTLSKRIRKIDLRDTLLGIPPEILEKVDAPSVIFDAYFSRKRNLHEAKLIIVGQGAVGKTSVIKRMTEQSYAPLENKTEGISIKKWSMNVTFDEGIPEKIQLNVWDFGGQEIMHATHQFFLTRRSIYLLVLDSRLTQEENRVEYWLKIIQSFGGDSPVLIVGNKTDQHPLDIDHAGLRKKYPNIVNVVETSAATGAGIDDLQAVIAEQIRRMPHVRDLLPETWFAIKDKLEVLGRKINFITQEKYVEFCDEHEIRDETSQRTLLGFLHDLGIVLHFQDDARLAALGILNPQWVTNGVYKILNAHSLFQNKGVLPRAMLDEILDFPEYPFNKRMFIVDMMRKFELCYDLEPDQTFLVPDLLPKDEPFTGEWDDTLAFQYHYNVLPSSIISRFIVRMNAYVHQPTTWRSGAVLKKGENTALVKADTEDRKIYIWVNGAENTRRDFLSAIRAEFETIHKTIIKIEAVEKVPVPGHPETEPIPFEMLSQAESEGRASIPVMSGGRLVDVNVRELLNGIAPETERLRASNVTNIQIGKDLTGTLILGDSNSARNTTSLGKLTAPQLEAAKPAKIPAEKPSLPWQIAHFVFIAIPRAIGRVPLDIFGKGKDAAESTPVLLGYAIIVVAILVMFGILGLEAVRDWFAGWWRFFNPVE